MDIQRHFTRTEWEPKVGYCRALRAGNLNPPVTTMVEVNALINADMLIEVEAEAFVA